MRSHFPTLRFSLLRLDGISSLHLMQQYKFGALASTSAKALLLKCSSSCRALEDSNRGEALDGRIDEEDARMKEDDLLPDPATFLESYPRCKRLLDTFRANPNTHNKTPLAVLHEYATRLSLEVNKKSPSHHLKKLRDSPHPLPPFPCPARCAESQLMARQQFCMLTHFLRNSNPEGHNSHIKLGVSWS